MRHTSSSPPIPRVSMHAPFVFYYTGEKLTIASRNNTQYHKHVTIGSKPLEVSIYLLLIALLFALLWLSQDIPAIVAGKAPQSVTENGLLTNPVHVLDSGFYLPAMIITAILLWRRKFLGYFFAVPLLVFSILTGIGIIAIDVVTGIRGMQMSPGVDLFIAAISLVSLILSVLFVREVRSQKDVSFA